MFGRETDENNLSYYEYHLGHLVLVLLVSIFQLYPDNAYQGYQKTCLVFHSL